MYWKLWCSWRRSRLLILMMIVAKWWWSWWLVVRDRLLEGSCWLSYLKLVPSLANTLYLILSASSSSPLSLYVIHVILIYLISVIPQTLHYGIRADILKKNYQKMFNFENWFLCQFSSNTWFFLEGALSTPQKLENAKRNLQISI